MVVNGEKISKYFIVAQAIPQTPIEVVEDGVDTQIENTSEYLANKKAEELAQIWTTLNDVEITKQ